VEILRGRGHRVAVVRHPMPYGDPVAQRVQRFETLGDLGGTAVTLEEREEYEPHLAAGLRGLHGVEYGEIAWGIMSRKSGAPRSRTCCSASDSRRDRSLRWRAPRPLAGRLAGPRLDSGRAMGVLADPGACQRPTVIRG